MTMGVWQAELRNGGALDAAQRKFLRETYSSAGREEVFEGWKILRFCYSKCTFCIFWHQLEKMLQLLFVKKC